MTRRTRPIATLFLSCAAATLLSGCGREQSAGPASAGADAIAAMPGKVSYERSCFSCHATGAAGAPRVGDAAVWAPRVAKGREALMRSIMQGVPPGMPPKGLCATCSDAELGEALDYMLAKSK